MQAASHPARRGTLGVLISISMLLAACSSAATPAPTAAPTAAATAAAATAAPTAAPTKPPVVQITLLTDFLLYGWHAPLFAGKSQGFYTDEAIDLTIQAGKGSADGATQVSAGAAQFGQLDAVSALTAISKGADLKLVGVYFSKYPGGMCYVKSRKTIATYKDLEGLKIGAAAGDAYMVALPSLMKGAGADPTKVETVTMVGANTTAALVGGTVDATPCGLPTFPDRQAVAAQQNLTLDTFLFADHGFNTIGFALVVSTKTYATNPSVVQRMVNAWAKSAVWSFANPDAAVAAFTTANPTLNATTAKASFTGVLPYLKGASGYFVFDKPSLQTTLDFVNQAYTATLQPAAVYTSQFVDVLPAAYKEGKLQ